MSSNFDWLETYKKIDNFSKKTIENRGYLAWFPRFNEHKIKKTIILSLIFEFQLHEIPFCMTVNEISRLIRMPVSTARRHIRELIKKNVLKVTKRGQKRELLIVDLED
jgi:DNA-binding MarR family transcriptional regulator